MLIEAVELNLARNGLGHLREETLLGIFADTQAHALIGEGTLSDVVDLQGRHLYPAYYHTLLNVPEGKALSDYKLWSKCSCAVEVSSFGGMILSSRYCLAEAGQIPSDPAHWVAFPNMSAGSMFIVDEPGGVIEAASPKKGCLQDLEKLIRPPVEVNRFRDMRRSGRVEPHFKATLPATEPIIYPLESGRDAFPGRNMMFATFSRIMDEAERRYLTRNIWPMFPPKIVDLLCLRERETWYFGNATGGETLRIAIDASLQPSRVGVTQVGAMPIAIFEASFQIFNATNNMLLAVSHVKKSLAIPNHLQDLQPEAIRLRNHFAPEQTIQQQQVSTALEEGQL